MYFPPCISDGPSVILFSTHEAWSEGLEAGRSKLTNIKRQKRPSPHSACSPSAAKTENSNATNNIRLRPPSPFQALGWQLSGHQDRNPLCNFNGSWFYFIIFYKPVHLISEKRKKKKRAKFLGVTRLPPKYITLWLSQEKSTPTPGYVFSFPWASLFNFGA